jgi:glycosyltransferase involved in cell wall biosynthesis
VLSEAAAERFEAYFARRPAILPGGVATAQFRSGARRAAAPTLVCAASLGDPRKRAGILFSAFARLRAELPDARLLLVRSRDPVMSGSVDGAPEGAEWVDGDDTEALARLYGTSWASVLPAVEEAFGLVLVESLAAGTPVVAARSGGCPEIVGEEGVGALFEPDDPDSLVAAMRAALDLGRADGIRDTCRRRAAEFDWGRVVERYEAVYDEATSPAGSAAAGRASSAA